MLTLEMPPMVRADVATLLNSGILQPEHLRSVVGAKVLYPEEFVDLWHLLPKSGRQRLFPLLDEDYYRSLRPDLAPEVSALVDFLHVGLPAGIDPHPLVDLGYIRFLRPDLTQAGVRASQFWSILAHNLVTTSPFFELKHYASVRKGNPASPSLIVDFLLRGAEAGCSPSPFVDIDDYRTRYPDVPSTLVPAFLHFVGVGDAAGRRAGSSFDPAWYRTHFAENGQPLARPTYHFLRYGRYANRSPKPDGAAAQIVPVASSQVAVSWTIERQSATIIKHHADVKARLADRAAARRGNFATTSIAPIVTADPEAILATLTFPEVETPEIDILIPCYEEFDKTVECLASIAAAVGELAVRVHVVDDCSADPRIGRLADVPGLRVRRNTTNLHFLRSCNGAWPEMTAPFVLLLNNDTQVFPDTLPRLLSAMYEAADIAAAAPMILYPDGRLQEAGCTVEADGDTTMIGVGDDPRLPGYRRDRDIAYGSGACLLVRRSAVGDILFDERFAPAYCEDVDLCLRLRHGGGRIRYVAEARCMHHLSASTSRNSERSRIRLIRRNQQKLLEKWGDALRSDISVRVLAFYLPQFHPVPENDLWWGKGFTEWTNVSKALPSYLGHYQPHLPADLGFYDLRLVDTMEAQMALARRYGLYGFIMYYYNFQGRRVLDRPLRNLLAKKDADFRFCLCWANENWTRHWDGGSKSTALMMQDYGEETFATFADDAVAAARLPGYITVNGRPLLLIYRPLLIPDVAAVCAQLRRRFAEAGFSSVYLAYVESMETATKGIDPASLGFDATVEFPPQGVGEPLKDIPPALKSAFMGQLYDYAGTVVRACTPVAPGYTRFPGVVPSWDNTPRQPLAHTTLHGALPERFQAYVEAKLTEVHEFLWGDERILVVNAWNEWAEGAHLEPDRAFEHDWLRAIADTLDARGMRDPR